MLLWIQFPAECSIPASDGLLSRSPAEPNRTNPGGVKCTALGPGSIPSVLSPTH